MEQFIEWLTANWQELTRGLYDLLIAIGGLILILKKTGRKAINKKIDEHIIKDKKKLDTDDYVAVVNGKEIPSNEVHFKKKEVKNAH